MTSQAFGIVFLVGAGAVALWLDVRFPRFAPSDLRRAMIRSGIAVAASRFLFPPIWTAAIARGSVLLALFAIAFPCLIYLLLSTLWSIKWLQASMRGAR
jgi:hypothetical protein